VNPKEAARLLAFEASPEFETIQQVKMPQYPQFFLRFSHFS
jgi:hypothetical protein